MSSLGYFVLAGVVAVTPAIAQGQGRPAPDAAAEHRGHGDAAPVPGARGQGRDWTRLPVIVAPGRGGERGAAVLRPAGIEVRSLQVYAADGPSERRKVEYPVAPGGEVRIAAAAPKVGNYHWVVAREESEAVVRVASTAWYFGNPGASPAAMLKESRHELEIVPDPLPREHGSYRESEKWRFLVRANGVPLPSQTVTLETEFGSRSAFVTDAAGYATVLFPRDFRPPSPGREAEAGHGPQRAKFVLATERESSNRRYVTAFNYTYGPDGDRNRSLGWGLFFGVVGMAAATPLLRRRAANKTEGARHA